MEGNPKHYWPEDPSQAEPTRPVETEVRKIVLRTRTSNIEVRVANPRIPIRYFIMTEKSTQKKWQMVPARTKRCQMAMMKGQNTPDIKNGSERIQPTTKKIAHMIPLSSSRRQIGTTPMIATHPMTTYARVEIIRKRPVVTAFIITPINGHTPDDAEHGPGPISGVFRPQSNQRYRSVRSGNQEIDGHMITDLHDTF